jgi:anti-anti-sigma factor
MSIYRRFELVTLNGSAGDITVVRLNDARIVEETVIRELGDELMAVVEKEKRNFLVINFAKVEFLSSAALNKLILVERAAKAAGGKVRVCGLRKELAQIFTLTRLDKLFEIKPDEKSALV